MVVIIIPKKLPLPSFYNDEDLTQEQQDAIDAYDARLILHNTARDEINLYQVSGDFEDVINQDRSATLIKDGDEYLLATLTDNRVFEPNIVGKVNALEDCDGTQNPNYASWITAQGYTVPEMEE